ncbi:class III extradiol ring-cleavage dioxygenase [Acetobacter estunensis]|uniref:DODA-type extradiol aromatic ring-opening family dioxygenase n=1 Tax=Acetobacter estunensis TaxID=104097 RepID=UPI001C2D2E58|nr:class III extradiol ring-cleavage dioxygenase [Acetobacter estunensis]MBV1836625.1 dioxygenase [Acetobacter estunensis]
MISFSDRQPVLFVPHGGGPCFFMDWPGWEKLDAHLQGLAETLPRRPSGILVMSGHWETAVPTVTMAERPELIFDYYGFPAHTYELTYPAPGSPALATRVKELLEQAGLPCAQDNARGFDHGVFIPFLLAFPDADIPVVELSMDKNLDATRELQVGRALEALRSENILIVATGMTYHNLRHFMSGDPATDSLSYDFDRWLTTTIEADPSVRDRNLCQWEQAPAARICHPREEHLLPLMFAAGAAGSDRGVRTYTDTVMGKALLGFRFG